MTNVPGDETPLTVGDLRKVMALLPDDAPVTVTRIPDPYADVPVTEVFAEQVIPWDHKCIGGSCTCPTVYGLELWLGESP